MKTPLLICRTERSILMTHIAKHLREQGIINPPHALLAYYDQWRDFLTTQKHTEIAGIHSLTDIFRKIPETSLDRAQLERIEREYGESSLWNLLFNEAQLAPHTHPRLITSSYYSPEDQLKYLQLSFEYYENLLDEHGIDCIIDIAMTGIFRTVLDRVAEKRGIPFLYPFNALLGDPIGDRFRVNTRALEKFDDVRDRYEQLLAAPDMISEGWKYLTNFRNSKQRSIYHFHLEALAPTAGPSMLERLNPKRALKKHWKGIVKEYALRKAARNDPAVRYNFQLHKGYWSTRQRRLLLEFARKTYHRWFVRTDNGPFTEPYVFMTLHLQPEATTSLFTPYHVNQLAVVENLSRAVPLGWKVVVKPNKTMVGTDTISFFRQLARIPNVAVTGYDADTPALISKAQAVVTLSGTSGLEAALHGKPVFLVAGHGVIWHVLKDVTRFSTWEELHTMLRDLECYRPHDVSLAAYLQAVYDTSFNLAEDYIWWGPYDLTNPEYLESLQRITTALRTTMDTFPERHVASGQAGAASCPGSRHADH